MGICMKQYPDTPKSYSGNMFRLDDMVSIYFTNYA